MRVISSASMNAAAPRTAMSARETLWEPEDATTAWRASSADTTDAVWRDRATGCVKLGPPRAGGGVSTLLAPPRDLTTTAVVVSAAG